MREPELLIMRDQRTRKENLQQTMELQEGRVTPDGVENTPPPPILIFFSIITRWRAVAIVLLSLGSYLGLRAQTTDPDSNKVDNDGDGAPVPFSIRSLLLAGLVAIGFCFGLHAQANNPNKVDDDGDGLIEIWNLSQLNHIRYNLAGTSYKATSDATGDTRGCGTNATAAVAAGGASGKCHGYELMANLDFSDKAATGYHADWDPVVQKAKAEAQRSAGWPPIGDGNHRFTGVFEGNNHTISNLFVNLKSAADDAHIYAGLFGFAFGSKIRNLGLTGEHTETNANATHNSSNSYAGGLVGYASIGTITNCYATGDVSSSSSPYSSSPYSSSPYSFAGGLVGFAIIGTITSCYATGSVSSSSSSSRSSPRSSAGGLVGYVSRSTTTIENCYATGDVSSNSSTRSSTSSFAGGLAGGASGTITNCYATGDVSSSSTSSPSYSGGLVGYVRSGGTITNCYATGSVSSSSSSSSSAGGLVGGASGTITNCYATGDVSSSSTSSPSYSGGLVGYASGTLTNCYATGAVTSTEADASDAYAGGVIGRNQGGTINACYYSGVVKKGTSSSNLGGAIQTYGQYQTKANLKMPTSARGIYLTWSTESWDFGTSQQLPTLLAGPGKLLSGQSGEHVKVTPPDLSAKQNALTYEAQMYTATFAGGILYHLLQTGGYSPSVTATNVRAGTSGGTVSPKELVLSNLRASTRYTLYAIVEASNGDRSTIVSRTFTTATFPVHTLGVKRGSLSYNSQTYETTFTGGTLYYLLQKGSYSSSVTATNVRAGTSGGTVSPKEIVLSSLQSGTQYTLYTIVEASNGDQSAIVYEEFRTPVVPVPTLRAQQGTLTRTTNIFSATFDAGTLYYLLKNEAYDSSVTAADIKAGTNGGSTSPKTISLSGLRANTRYTLYTISEASNGDQSAIVYKEFRTPEVPTPTLAAKDGTLSYNRQTYTTTFSVGTLHYLLKTGAYSSSVAKNNIKSANKSLSRSGDLTLGNLRASTQYTLYTVTEARNGDQSAIVFQTFMTEVFPVPTLASKEGELEYNRQTYTATFSVGMLHWQLQAGNYSRSVSTDDIKTDGTPAGAATNKGSAEVSDSPKDISLTSLRASTRYTLYTIVEASNGDRSAIVSQTFTTTAVPTPGLYAKYDALTHNAQTYTANFSVGSLHWLLRTGEYSRWVSTDDIKTDGTPAGAVANKGLAGASDSPKEVSLTGLKRAVTYTLYAFVEASNTDRSAIVSDTFTTPVDEDRDGLIEIWSLTDLNSIRYNLAGTSYKSTLGAQGIVAGCPRIDHDGNWYTASKPTCHGYELMADLDFWSDDDTKDEWKDDEGDQSNIGWIPIGDGTTAFSATFEGNGHSISNLYVNVSSRSGNVYSGLFGHATGTIRSVGVVGTQMSVSAHSSFAGGYAYAGGLVGVLGSTGKVINSYAAGTAFASAHFCFAGGLVGSSEGTIRNVYATSTVSTSSSSVSSTGASNAGGLVGSSSGTTEDAYALGEVYAISSSSPCSAGGLVGLADGAIANVYTTGRVRAAAVDALDAFVGGIKGSGSGTVTAGYYLGVVRKGTSSTVDSATAIQTPSQYRSGTQLRALVAGALNPLSRPNGSGWKRQSWDFGSASEAPKVRAYEEQSGRQVEGEVLPGQEGINSVVPTDPNAPPAAPSFSQKAGFPSHNAQAYTVSFSGGALYYMHKPGGYDPSVSKADVKAANRSLPSIGDVTIGSLTLGTQYTLYAFVERSSLLQSEVAYITFSTPGALPVAPVLTAKRNALAHESQVYTATFASGTLYYLLKAGAYDRLVDVAAIKSADQSLSSTNDLLLDNLTASVRYTLYAFVERGGQQSSIEHATFTTLSAPVVPDTPTLTAKEGLLTHESQTYTATFDTGTLYYLVKFGAHDRSINTTTIKSARQSLSSAGDVVLGGLIASRQYTLYAFVEHGGQQSPITHATFATLAVPVQPPVDDAAPVVPAAPRLTQKVDALTHESQIYEAAFSSGMLYYLVRAGAYNQSVDVSDIKAANQNLNSAGDVVLGGLTVSRQYTLYAFVERDGQQSPIAHATFTTPAAPVQPPVDDAAPVVPAAPRLTQKVDALTHESQIYAADFSLGLLYYLLKTGSHDGSVNAANIKSANQSLNSAGDVVLRGLTANRRYTLYAFVERSGQQSPVAHATFATLAAPVVPDAPTLTVKTGFPRHNSQTYTAAFASGTLYYLLKSGPYDGSINATDIKASNENLALESDLLLNDLTASTRYTLYAFVEHGGQQSAIVHSTFTTLPFPAPPPPAGPVLEKGEVAATTVVFTSTYNSTPNGELIWIIVEGDEAKNPLPSAADILSAYENKKLSGEAVKERGVQLESGLLENDNGSTEGQIDGLESDTQYVLYAVYDEDTTDGESGIVEAHPFITKKAEEAVRSTSLGRVEAYPNPTSGVLHVPMPEGVAEVYDSGGTKVGSFEVSEGQIDLSDLPSGTYVIRLLERVFWVVRQ